MSGPAQFVQVSGLQETRTSIFRCLYGQRMVRDGTETADARGLDGEVVFPAVSLNGCAGRCDSSLYHHNGLGIVRLYDLDWPEVNWFDHALLGKDKIGRFNVPMQDG